jgi:AcrR family transcriptional regulator
MSPRTDKQNRALREESQARLLDSALRLFAREGYERTTVRMIAEDAGVAQGLLYNYFDGKEGLLRALFERSMRDVAESFALAEDDPDPRVRLAHYIRGSFAVLRRNLSFWRLSYHVRMQPGVAEGLGPKLAEWTAAIRAELERHMVAIGRPDPAVEAEILFALIDGVSQHYVLEPETYPLDAVADRIVALYTGE